MIGHPTESHRSIENTIDFALRSRLTGMSVCLNTPLPGSEQYRHVHEHVTYDEDYARFDFMQPVFVPHGLTGELLVEKANELRRRFYSRSRVLAWYLRFALRRPSHVVRTIDALGHIYLGRR
jgi:hypothetical protein